MGISNIPVAPKASLQTSLRPSVLLLHSRATVRTQIHNGQIRSFKLGLWSAWEDPRLEKESRRKCRIAKERYIESLNKRLSWDRHFPASQKQVGLKGFMCSTWRAQEGKSGQHWYLDESGNIKSRNSKDNEKGNEDMERTSADRLWKYANRGSIYASTRSRVFGNGWSSNFITETFSRSPQMNSFSQQGDPMPKKDQYQESQNSSYEVESEIDPITNRRVVRNHSSRPKHSTSESTDVPLKAFKGYRSQFDNLGPPETHPINNPVEEGLKEYDGRVDYETHKLYDPAETSIDYSDPIQEGLKAFDEKIATKPLDTAPVEESRSSIQRDPKGMLKERENFATPLDPIEEAIQEYETHEEHPEITQQVRDQHIEARKNARRAAARHSSGAINHISADGQHSSRAQADPLLETIQEYSTCPPTVETPSTARDPIQEGLEAYDNKADYDPKHIVELPVKHTDYPGCDAAESFEYELDDLPSRNLAKHISLDQYATTGIRTRKELEADFEKTTRLSPAEEAAAVDKVKNTPKLIQDLQIETSELRNHVAHARSRIDAKLAEVEAGWEQPEDNKKMTGNFVRDFPEEFENSWSQSEANSGSLMPKARSERQVESDVQEGERSYVDGIASREAFTRDPETPRLETALDRAASGKANSGEAMLLEKENDKNLIREVRNIYEDSYGTINCKHRQVSEAENANSARPIELADSVGKPVPTLYKILAYDPTMQSISTAETTSVVPDSAAPLTPAEVLLRLSNPAKFFPHFQPLQSQGFEIVSGSGDVLVFRKVRSGPPPEQTSPAQERMRSTNPIDGMSCPTGDFASPTGFVNHDIHRGATEPPFKSNIDVRREEPVFSGKRNWQDENEVRKPRSAGKRILIGAAWVAACSYAVGVVFDFFKTGGMDGLGPQGF